MAKVFLDTNETFILSGPATVFGNTGSEKVLINGSSAGVAIASTVERVEFSGTLNSYAFSIVGNQMTVRSGATVITTLGVDAGQTLAFADGSAAVNITGLGAATIGNAPVSTTATGALLVTALNITDKSTVAVSGTMVPTTGQTATVTVTGATGASAATPYDASTGKVIFNISTASASYDYFINGFAAGDAIKFTAGTSISIANASFTDGAIDISGTLTTATGANAVVVHLTGLATSIDAGIFGLANFNGAAPAGFGAGSLG